MAYGNLAFVLENDEQIVLPISKGENGLFGVGTENVPEGFKMYNYSFGFGSIGALIFCECHAQKMHTTNVRKVVVSREQLYLIFDYLRDLPDYTYSFECIYNLVTKQYDTVPRRYPTNKDFPVKGIELVLTENTRTPEYIQNADQSK